MPPSEDKAALVAALANSATTKGLWEKIMAQTGSKS